MTSLVVTPNVKRKTLKFEGRIAAGEHVLVRVETFDDKVGEGKSLRLRAVAPNGDTLAMFPPHVKDDDPPRPQEELVWQVDGGDATCVFDFNTVQAEKFLRCGGECLFVLDDVGVHTLYGNGFCTVAPWAKENGLDVPVDLDGYKDVGERVTVLEDEIASIGEKADAAFSEASSAKSTADSAARVAETARTDAVAAGNAAISAASSASEAQTGAAAASSAADSAATSASDAAASAKSASDKFDALSDVAKSGRYEDLLDKPSIPSIAGLATKTELSREESRAKGVEQNILNRLAKTPSLDDGGKVPASQLPSYVDDVIEYVDRTRFPAFGESGKIYVDMSTNRLYRWTGTVYVQIPSGLALGETASTAYPGDKGAANASDIANLKTSKQDALNARQLAAVNSGITAEKLANLVAKSDVEPLGDGTEVIARIGGKEIRIPKAGDPSMISDNDGNVINADGSANVADGSWTCNGVVLKKSEGRDDYWENAERRWGLGHVGVENTRWVFTNGSGSASMYAPLDSRELEFAIGGETYSLTIGRADSVLMAGDAYTKNETDDHVNTAKRYVVAYPSADEGSVYQLSDFAVNVVNVSSPGEYTFVFPPRTGSRVRDFVLKLNVTADPLPTVSFVKHETDDEPPRFEGDDGWSELELGVNFFGFTESS